MFCSESLAKGLEGFGASVAGSLIGSSGQMMNPMETDYESHGAKVDRRSMVGWALKRYFTLPECQSRSMLGQVTASRVGLMPLAYLSAPERITCFRESR